MDKKERVIVYVDGFNFYYGLKKNCKEFYWLDVVKLFDSFMRDNQELLAVKYFSARPENLEKSRNQNAFFQANNENKRFQLILGKYLKKEIICYKCNNVIHTHEEKETDVRIATQIVADAYKDKYDIAIVVSADSDMIPAIELAIEANKRVFVYFPPNQYSSDLATLGSGSPLLMQRYKSRFRKSLLPDAITLSHNGFTLEIPEKWKAHRRGK